MEKSWNTKQQEMEQLVDYEAFPEVEDAILLGY